MLRLEVAERVKVCSNTASGEVSMSLMDSELVAQMPRGVVN
jgi:hypothetical protein